jgi:glutaminase
MPELQTLLDSIVADAAGVASRGNVADYIPELASIDPARFGIAVVTKEGRQFEAGDAVTPFSIQSISKVFALTLALGKAGDGLWQRVGREPSGSAFNSIVLLEHEKGIPRNPFINAGAIAVTDIILAGHEPREAIGEFLRLVRFLAEDESIFVDNRVAASETSTGHRNFALAHYMKACGNLDHPVEHTLGVYFHHCATAMSCRQLAMAGRYLAFGGRHPATGQQVVSSGRARRINALMLTCGQYDGSGDFAFRVGLPAKSGVGGGILAIVPGVASIAVWSPGLNEHGNSLLGTRALEQLAEAMGWSVFSGLL